MCGCAGRRRRRGDAGGADGAPTPRDGAYAAGRGGGRKGFPPSGAGPRRSSPRRGCRGSPRSSGRAAAAERAHPERSPAGPALAAGPGPPRPGVVPAVPAGEMEEGTPIPVPAAHRASLISVTANSCSAC